MGLRTRKSRVVNRKRLSLELLETRDLLHAEAVLSGFVFVDRNENATRDGTELGVPGVVVNLSGNNDSNAPVNETALTDDNGFYSFGELEPGTYDISKRQSEAMFDGLESDDTRTATSERIVLADDENLSENNFAELGVRADYLSVHWFFASAASETQLLRDTLALAEEMAGNSTLAESIRSGGTEVPDELNTPPTANNDRYDAPVGGTLTVAVEEGVLANDVDEQDDPLTAVVVLQPTNGGLSFNSDGSFTYSPNAGFSGTDTFTYSANDGQVSSNVAEVSVDVAQVTQVTATLSASKDATLYEQSVRSVANGAGQYIFTGKTNESTNSLRRALIAFDVANEIPDGATITDVTLELNMSRTIVGPMDVSLHRVTTEWEQGTSDQTGEEGGAHPVAPTPGDATWIHSIWDFEFWTNPGGDFDTAPSATTSVDAVGSYQWNSAQMVADVQDWLDNASDNYGWILITDETLTSAKRFDSRENGNADNEPRLVVEYTVPDEPDEPNEPNEPFGAVTSGSFQDPDLLGIRTDLEPGALPISAEHVTTAVDYSGYSNPPTYGPHHGFLLDSQGNSITPRPTGVYESEQPDEDLLHNLEHGHVWISYNPTLISNEDLSALEQLVVGGGTDTGVILTPRAANSDAIALASWARLLTLENFDATQVRDFIETNRGKSPEGFIPSGQKADTSGSEDLNDGLAHTPPMGAPNSAPTAIADAFDMDQGTTLTIAASEGLLANDLDSNSDPLSASVVTTPSDGSLSLNTDGSFTYSPNANFVGSDTFTYVASDGNSISSPATVTITVLPVNRPPLAANDQYSVDENLSLTVTSSTGVLANDSDPDGDALTATLDEDVDSGQLSLNPDGSFTYVPDTDFDGTDLFTYTLSDGELTSTGSVVITVNPVNNTQAFSVTMGPSQDTTLVEDPNGEIGNGSATALFSGVTNRSTNAIRRALLAFDPVNAGIPSGAMITNVELLLNMSRTNFGDRDFSLHRLLSDWGEGGTAGGGAGAPTEADDATWIHSFAASALWNEPGGDFETNASATATVGDVGWYSWASPQMIADVQSWIDNPSGNFGWILVGDETQTSSKRFHSRESPDASSRPKLLIEYEI